jgi:RHS repeat-associated protein
MLTDKLFTGQRQIAELGIYHYGARFYSPKLGRFLSADTITPNPANPQNLNRFSYVTNNPLRYIDPTGHKACEDGDGQGSCLSDKQATKKYKAKQEKIKAKSKKNKEKPVSEQTVSSIDDGESNGSGHLASTLAQDDFCNSGPNGSWGCGVYLDPDETDRLLTSLNTANLMEVAAIAGLGFLAGGLVGGLATRSPSGIGAGGFFVATITAAITYARDTEYEQVMNEISLASDLRPSGGSEIFVMITQSSSNSPIELRAIGQNNVTISDSTLGVISQSIGLDIP